MEPLKQDFQQQVSILNEQEKEKQSKTIELLKLQNSLSTQACSTCGSKLTPEKIDDLKSEQLKLQNELLNFGNFNEINFNLMTKIKSLDLSPQIVCEVEKYKARKDNQIGLDRDILDLENEMYSIDQQLVLMKKRRSQHEINMTLSLRK